MSDKDDIAVPPADLIAALMQRPDLADEVARLREEYIVCDNLISEKCATIARLTAERAATVDRETGSLLDHIHMVSEVEAAGARAETAEPRVAVLEGVLRETFIRGANWAHYHTVEGTYNDEPGDAWDDEPSYYCTLIAPKEADRE